VWQDTISRSKELWDIGKTQSRNAYNTLSKNYGLNDTINREILERYTCEIDYPGEKERIEKIETEDPERLFNPFYELKGESHDIHNISLSEATF
jgi:hypothetical protein